jgi:hypothetical protein
VVDGAGLDEGKRRAAHSSGPDQQSGEPPVERKCWSTLAQHYGKAKYWPDHQEFFGRMYETHWERLVDINEAIIRYLLAAFSIGVKIVKSSELKVSGAKGDLLLDICRQVDADIYLSGVSGKDYLELEKFETAGIAVRFQDFRHPIYKQLYEPFMPCMSAMDLLFNYGPASLDVIKGVGVETMDHVFE